MYIRSLSIKHLKRLREFDLTFPEPRRGPRGKLRMPWTVLIGENGTCKTAILQAIAMTATGSRQVTGLAQPVIPHLCDRRGSEPFTAEASFSFPPMCWEMDEVFPVDTTIPTRDENLRLTSTVQLQPGESTVYGGSFYVENARSSPSLAFDPLDIARSKSLPFWFVAGYSVARVLPSASATPAMETPGTNRLQPLFNPLAPLVSTAFANYFADQPVRGRRFAGTLKKALFPDNTALLPDLVDLELRGQGGVTTAADLVNRHRFKQRLGSAVVGIPAVALAHGYQSTIAWIADLVGHILLEAESDVPPNKMTGLVLVDEIDLYIHPALQVSLIRSLKRTFPQIQFVVTTHSPLVLAAMRPDEDEIVRLAADPQTGDVHRVDMKRGSTHEPDARTMTTAAILQQYFGLPGLFGGPEGEALAEFQSLAFNVERTDVQNARMLALRKQLESDGVDVGYAPLPRRQP